MKPVVVALEYSALVYGASTREGLKRLDAITIRDGGVGFTQENYRRFLSLNDRSKSALNKGSGRVQFVKAFERADYESVYRDSSGALMKRAFSLSASEPYLRRNALVRETLRAERADATQDALGTTLRLLRPFTDEKTRKLEETTAEEVKAKILARFFLRLNGAKRAPKIEIVVVNGAETERATIDASDRAAPRSVVEFSVPRKFVETTGKRRFVKTGESERFVATCYAVKGSFLSRNVEAFVSRGEVVADAKLGLADASETISGFRYVVAIEGERVDSAVLESRDGIALPRDKDFFDAPLLTREEKSDVSLDDVRKEARDVCERVYPELASKRAELAKKVEQIGARFGFAKTTTRSVLRQTPLNSTTTDVLKRLYDKEAGNAARTDASVDALLDGLNDLDPTAPDYQERLKERADRLFELTPERNRAELAHYFARRKIVLNVLGKALEKKLDAQNKEGRSQEESAFHNVLFSRRSHNPSTSDLWIINEEFVHFQGTSDVPFYEVEHQGKRVFEPFETFAEKDREYYQKKMRLRPDILLFPEEGKCVVVELKAPGVDLSEFIPQINKYVGFVFKYSAPEFKIAQFYVYLVGGEFNPQDVRDVAPEYRLAKRFGYMFATRNVPGKEQGEQDGEMYAEIHTYRSFYQRAVERNRAFLEILLNDDGAETKRAKFLSTL